MASIKNFKVGIDLEEISRFSTREYAKHKNFYKKIFTPDEINYCLRKKNPYPHFAGRFCAKEAVIKALGISYLKLTEIEIIIKNKKPIIVLPKKQKCILSISHTQQYAIAIVLVI